MFIFKGFCCFSCFWILSVFKGPSDDDDAGDENDDASKVDHQNHDHHHHHHHDHHHQAKQSGSAASFNCTGAVRKAGFLSVKKWLLRKKHQVTVKVNKLKSGFSLILGQLLFISKYHGLLSKDGF